MTSLLHPWERSEGRTSVCFRYVTRRRPSRVYDVRIVLKDDPRHGEIDIRQACRTSDDLPSFTSGFLSVARLRTIASLAGLIERVTARDHSRNQPGALVFGGHLSFPFERRGDGAARASRAPSVQRKHIRQRTIPLVKALYTVTHRALAARSCATRRRVPNAIDDKRERPIEVRRFPRPLLRQPSREQYERYPSAFL